MLFAQFKGYHKLFVLLWFLAQRSLVHSIDDCCRLHQNYLILLVLAIKKFHNVPKRLQICQQNIRKQELLGT